MNLDRLITFFANNPSARLLRAQHAPYIVHFLYLHFKKQGHLASLNSALQQHLGQYLESLHQTDPDFAEALAFDRLSPGTPFGWDES